MQRIQCLEQSRAEQSRAEQSRAEQLDCCVKLGNAYNDEKFTGGNYGGNVWDINGIAPTMKTGASASQQCTIEVKKMDNSILGNLQPSNPHHSQNVYDSNSVAPTIMAGTHGYGMGNIVDKQIVAMRGRDKDNPSDRTVGNTNLEQRLEPNSQGICTTITSVQKDNLVLEKDMVVLGNYMPSNHDASRVVDIGGVAPTVKENHGTVTGIVDVRQCPKKEQMINEIKVLGKLDNSYDQSARVYDSNGISPTIMSNSHIGGYIPTKCVEIRQATKDGFIKCELPGVADLEYPSSNTRSRRVIEGGADKSYFDNEEYP